MFEWDEANLGHIAEHGVAQTEAEEAVLNEPIDLIRQSRNGEERLVQIGETHAGRILSLVTTFRKGKLRVVTAFPANRKYRLFYAAQKKGQKRGEEDSS